MMFLLRRRAEALTERMDEAGCDPAKLARTYAQFEAVNALVSSWGGVYRSRIRPELQAGARTVLDIGCGGGDVLRRLAAMARKDGFSVDFLGVDPDFRAIDFARTQKNPANVRFEAVDARELTGKYDIVVSNHVAHHLTPAEIPDFCAASERLAARLALHCDLRRSGVAYALFPLIGGWFSRSFILEDGLRSIRRAYLPEELSALVPNGWQVRSSHPFRLQLAWRA